MSCFFLRMVYMLEVSSRSSIDLEPSPLYVLRETPYVHLKAYLHANP